MYVRTYVRMYACMHACMHACMYVCTYVYMYVYMYTRYVGSLAAVGSRFHSYNLGQKVKDRPAQH